jgi:hypothetical protein
LYHFFFKLAVRGAKLVSQAILVTLHLVRRKQCDQLGRILARWVNVYFGHFYYVSNPHFGATFSPQLRLHISLAQNGLGLVLGDFFTNSSGHPGRKLP